VVLGFRPHTTHTAELIPSQGGEALHKNYAGIGYSWDGTGFSAPQPFASWSLNSDTYLWEAPTPMPVEEGKRYTWDEATTAWVEAPAL
jgi:hypothetical protein